MVLFLMVMGNMASIYQNKSRDASKKTLGGQKNVRWDAVIKLAGLWVEMEKIGLKIRGILGASTY